MHNPPHPGEVLKNEVIRPRGLSVKDAAVQFSMSRSALSRVLNGKAAMSPRLAARLEEAQTGSARSWLMMQANYDRQNT